MRPNMFVDQYFADDMQQDTFRLVAGWVFEAQRALHDKQLDSLERKISCLMLLAMPRIPKKYKEDYRSRRNSIRDRLYGKTQLTPGALSSLLDDMEDLLEDVLYELDRAGILYRIRADVNSIAAE